MRYTDKDRGYKDYPLPDSWTRQLARLEPAGAPGPLLPHAPELSAYVCDLLGVLTEREKTVLFLRWVRQETLERTGEKLGGITRERVRQIEARAVRRFRENRELLGGFLNWVDDRRLCVALLQPSRSAEWPQATTQDLWQFMVQAAAAVTHLRYETMPLAGGTWVMRAESCCSIRLRSLFESEPRFRSVQEVARHIGVGATDLGNAAGFEPQLRYHAGALLGWNRWNNADCLVAMAWFLAHSGIRTWHFSQMAKALTYVWPDRFDGLSGRDVLGILSRPGFDSCQNAGRNGVWQLTAKGDGFRNNREAVVALLRQADRPMAADEILAGLRRVARPATIQALLARDPAFETTNSGLYTLSTQPETVRA